MTEQETLKERLQKAKEERIQKKKEMLEKMNDPNQKNPLDSEFPDITAKPGNFLPSIFSAGEKGDFDINNLNKDVQNNA